MLIAKGSSIEKPARALPPCDQRKPDLTLGRFAACEMFVLELTLRSWAKTDWVAAEAEQKPRPNGKPDDRKIALTVRLTPLVGGVGPTTRLQIGKVESWHPLRIFPVSCLVQSGSGRMSRRLCSTPASSTS